MRSIRSPWSRRALAALAMALAMASAPAGAAAQTSSRLQLTSSKAVIIDLTAPASKVAVANPGIADVQVITPAQLLVIGRAAGVTSLAVFGTKSVTTYDVVVYPSPMGAVAVGPVTGAPHAVVLQKADKTTEQIFIRDGRETWVELGGVQAETEAPKR